MARGITAILGILAGLGPISAAAVVGTYEGAIQTGTSRDTIVLRCETATLCELEARSVVRGASDHQFIERFSDGPADLEGARMALRFARAQRSRLAAPEYRGFAALRPLLNSSTDLSRCSATRSGNLVCELQSSPWNKPAVLYLAAQLAECNDPPRLFCAYVMVPLFQTSAVAKVTPQDQARLEARPKRRQPLLDITPPEKYPMVAHGGTAFVLYGPRLSREVDHAYSLFSRHAFGEAYPLLLALAERGEPIAQTALGIIYREGLGRPRDLQQALHWLTKADEQGSKWAAYAIAQIYDDGILVPRDIEQAKKWYFKVDGEQGSRYQELHVIRPDLRSTFFAEPAMYSRHEPRGWVADEQREAYLEALYERLAGTIRLPAGFPKGVSTRFNVVIAPDGRVIAVQRDMGWIVPREVKPDYAKLEAAAAAIPDGIRAASPLPLPPAWGFPIDKIRIRYPPQPPQTR